MFCKVNDLMTSPFFYVKADATIDECIELFLRHHISGLPVLDNEQRPVGLVSEFDLLQLVYDLDKSSANVSNIMTPDVITIEFDATLVDATDLFLSTRLRRLPVMRDGRMVGILSRRELVRHIGDMRKRVTYGLKKRRELAAADASNV